LSDSESSGVKLEEASSSIIFNRIIQLYFNFILQAPVWASATQIYLP
jgi:hypothetical protein